MEKLTYTERMILEYIRFRTNGKYPQLFECNETIARAICITKSSAKVIINNLIRKKYLIKSTDAKHKRCLSLSGKEYPGMPWVNLSNVSKCQLKKERDAYLHDYEEANNWGFKWQKESEDLQEKCRLLELENAELKEKIKNLENKINPTTEQPMQTQQGIDFGIYEPKQTTDLNEGNVAEILKGIQQKLNLV